MSEQASEMPEQPRKRRKYTRRETDPVQAALNECAKMSPLQLRNFRDRFNKLVAEIAEAMQKVASGG